MGIFSDMLRPLIRRSIPFSVLETNTAEAATALFKRSFGADPPTFPRHFIAFHNANRAVAAYIHFTKFEPGVYLCGGLCVDKSVYRALTKRERAALARRGSLSRWLIEESVDALGPKRAVFTYTGNITSRRDGFAVGCVTAAGKYLIVQWHQEPESSREDLVRRVEALGPF